jgi:hypothetical protein
MPGIWHAIGVETNQSVALTRRLWRRMRGNPRPIEGHVANKKILLIEPGYRNKYPPLGLMKIAQYHGPHGKRDHVRFVKGREASVLLDTWDRIYVTTLFSFEFDRIAETIDFAIAAAHNQTNKVFVGGIAASLMTERFQAEPRWTGVRFIRGLLSEAPAVSLQLDDFAEELYAEDRDSTPIEDLVPDYSILGQIEYAYPVRDAYFAYASRGCIRKCSFCGVPKLEGALRDTDSISAVVHGIDRLYGPQKDLILMDNNVVASPRFKNIIAEIRDLGFTPNAKLRRGGRTYSRRVDFNQGVDARILAKDRVYLRELSRIAIRPLRIAFDHWGLRAPYEQSIRFAHEFGLDNLSNYMLYNFHDTPRDLFERMRLNVALNEELGIRIFSFPMRYQPTDLPNRSHVGEHWTRYELRGMQIILQATHGVVSGEPTFFRRAFGDTYEEFEDLLLRPQHMLFNRAWYDEGPELPRFEDFSRQLRALSSDQRRDLLAFLSAHDPSRFAAERGSVADAQTRRILEHYVPPPKSYEQSIWAKTKERQQALSFMPAAEELVEDAGLDVDIDGEPPARRTA